MKVEIINWDKYNPRNDAKAWSWFRMQNDFLEDPDFDDLLAADLLVFVFLCSCRSKAAKPIFKVSLKQAAERARCSTADVEHALRIFEAQGKIKVHERQTYVNVRERTLTPKVTCPTDVRTYGRDDTDVTNDTVTGGVPPDRITPLDSPPLALAKPHEPKTPGSRVWAAYREAYLATYGQEAKPNAKNYAHCKQLVDRLGEEGAVAVVRFYLSHKNSWYVQRCHPLDACVKDAEGLHTQAMAGHRVTSSSAREQDKQQDNAQVFATVAARMEARRAGKDVPDAGE